MDYICYVSIKKTDSLQVHVVNLVPEDKILIRDGDKEFHDLLTTLTSSYNKLPSYVQSTGRHLYITMQTRSADTSGWFIFRYYQGIIKNVLSYFLSVRLHIYILIVMIKKQF